MNPVLLLISPGILEIKCIQNSRKKKFHKLLVVVLLKIGCFVKHMLCTIFAQLSLAKTLEKHLLSKAEDRRLATLLKMDFCIGLFKRIITFTSKNLPNGYFTPNISNKYFSELLFLAAEKKINKVYQWKLKPGDRQWVFEIAPWKLCL